MKKSVIAVTMAVMMMAGQAQAIVLIGLLHAENESNETIMMEVFIDVQHGMHLQEALAKGCVKQHRASCLKFIDEVNPGTLEQGENTKMLVKAARSSCRHYGKPIADDKPVKKDDAEKCYRFGLVKGDMPSLHHAIPEYD